MRVHALGALVTLAALVLVLSACGASSDIAKPNGDGVIEITMKDLRFDPDRVEVEAGEHVTFRFTNEGSQVHEAFIGTMADQQEHEAEMKRAGGTMDSSSTSSTDHEDHMSGSMSSTSLPMSHGDEPVVQVGQGKSGELTYTAAKAGTLLIGCHQPGHWKAGMRANLKVS